MKKLITLILALTLALTLCACGAKTEEPAEDTAEETTETAAESSGEAAVTVGISLFDDSSERYYSDGRYLQEQFEAAGYQVILQYTDAESGNQDEDVIGLISQGAGLLVIDALDSDGLSVSMAEAKAQGIPVVAYDRLINDTDALSAYVSFDNYAVGALQGASIRDALDLDNAAGPFNIELVAGSPTDTNAPVFFAGAMDVLQPYIDAGKLVVPSGETSFEQCATLQWDTAQAQSRFERILADYYAGGTVLDAVLCGNDAIAHGVGNALAGGYTGGNLPVITGQDGEPDSLRAIKDGRQTMTVSKNFEDEAAVAVAVSRAILEGRTLDAALADTLPAEVAFDAETYNNGAAAIPAYLLVPDVITAENVDQYMDNVG